MPASVRPDGVLLSPVDGHWLVVCDDPAALCAEVGPGSTLVVAALFDRSGEARRTVRLVEHLPRP